MSVQSQRPLGPLAPASLEGLTSGTLLCLLAFGLRLYRLGSQSLWYDEAASLFAASQPLASLSAPLVLEPHPPLYFLLLHGWMVLAGSSEFSLRFLSVLFSVLAIAGIYRLGALLLGMWVGVFAAALAALSPFLVYYAQETRMYALLLAFSVLSFLSFLRLLRQGRGWPLYVAITTATLWTHYFGLFVLVWENLVFLLLWPKRRYPLGKWMLAQTTCLLLFLPWVLVDLQRLGTYRSAYDTALSLAVMLQKALLAFQWGVVDDPAAFGWTLAPLGILLAAGLLASPWLARGSSWWEPGLILLASFIVPFLCLLSLSFFRPAFHPRYLIMAAPAYFVALGAALGLVSRWQRPLAWALLVLLAFTTFAPLKAYFHDPRLAREDFRSAAQFLESRQEEGDAILFNAWYARYPFDYYYGGALVRSGPFLRAPLTETEVVAGLNEAAQGHQRLWLVLWQDEVLDPGRYVLLQLDRFGEKVAELWLGELRVFVYHLPQGDIPPFHLTGTPNPYEADFGGQFQLVGYDATPTALRAGEWLKVALFWRAETQLSQDYRGFVHLMDDRQLLFGQQDKVPLGDYYPPSRWPVGPVLRDEYVFQVLPGTPPGAYRLEVGIYVYPSLGRLSRTDTEDPLQPDRAILPVLIHVAGRE